MDKRKIINDERRKDSDVDLEIENLEEQLSFMLNEYDVEYPSESEMMMTIDAIRPYVPVKENRWRTLYESMLSIVKQSSREFFQVSLSFWILNSIFLFIGLAVVLFTNENPYVIMMILAPIPTITGILEVLKSRNAAMAELEMSLKYSLQEIILSKMVVVGGYNLIVNLILTISISIFHPEVWIWKLTLYWVTPFTVITAISLITVSRFRNPYVVTAMLAVWIVAGIFISQSQVIEKIESLPAAVYFLITIVAAIIAFYQSTIIYKRGVTHEFNH